MRDRGTIAAIATATAPAGVGVVRVSGADAINFAATVLRTVTPLAAQPSATLRRMEVTEPQTGEVIDDGLVAVFRAPNSFTGENVVELQGHGGSVTLGRVLAAVLSAGARLARPGEFSERAFVAGKLDLAQAEAVASLIEAQTVTAQRAARRQLSGAVSLAVGEATTAIGDALARIEASIDFPEDVGELLTDVVATQIVFDALTRARTIAANLLATATYGKRLTEGITLVLAGRPNVGKSSLLNALSGYERAIVSPIAGTTRDIVEEALQIGGIPIRALDTAGIRETGDAVEQIGVARARGAVETADVVVAVIDGAEGVTPEDAAFLRSLVGRAVVVAVNKSDAANVEHAVREAATLLPNAPVVAVAARTGHGLPALSDAILSLLGANNVDTNAALITSARHTDALRRAANALDAALQTLTDGLPAELIAVDAHAAIACFGEITGQTAREEIIAGIFSRFCIGK
ncbi:MAG: tRNA uridine-5-carboxymethylaminomethyl(34) synthesis GTPase MnmE [Armatimonadetes bacterium]|nr:tRNA uridine-5-carboxymethylaminomethyl(34) synthesis GTPase MnmE [Armatimonadota bacterium]